MISEIENLEKGIVVSTIEYDANKRIIGIGTPTITPNPTTGIAPLSKQTAFVPEEKESLAQVAEKVLGANPNQAVPVQEPMSGEQPVPVIPTPSVNDSITTEAVNVEIPTELGDLSTVKEVAEPIKSSIAEIAKSIPNPEENKLSAPEITVPVTEPIATPQDVLATEPSGINENLFATTPVPAIEPMAPVSVENSIKQVEPTEQSTPAIEPLSVEQPVIKPETPAPLSFEPRVEPKEEVEKEVAMVTESVPVTETLEPQKKELQTNIENSTIGSSATNNEKEEMAKKIANIVAGIVTNKVTEIAYNAAYEEVIGLLNELEKEKNINEDKVMNEEPAITEPQTLINPMLVQETEPTMRLTA